MEPKTEVVVFGILVTYFDIFSSDPEVLLLDGRVELVIIEHHSWLYVSIEGDFVPISVEKEPWAKADFLNGGLVAFIYAARNYAPGAILPYFLAWDSLPIGILGVFFPMVGLLDLDDEAYVVDKDLCHFAMAEHDVLAWLITEERTALAWLVDDAYRGEILSADHGENLGEFGLGMHTVDDLLYFVEVLFGFCLMDGDGLVLLPDFAYLVTHLLGSRHFEQMTCFLIEFEI